MTNKMLMEGCSKKKKTKANSHSQQQTNDKSLEKKIRGANFPKIRRKIHHRLKCVGVVLMIVSSFKTHHNLGYFVISIENVLHLVDRYSSEDID